MAACRCRCTRAKALAKILLVLRTLLPQGLALWGAHQSAASRRIAPPRGRVVAQRILVDCLRPRGVSHAHTLAPRSHPFTKPLPQRPVRRAFATILSPRFPVFFTFRARRVPPFSHLWVQRVPWDSHLCGSRIPSFSHLSPVRVPLFSHLWTRRVPWISHLWGCPVPRKSHLCR